MRAPLVSLASVALVLTAGSLGISCSSSSSGGPPDRDAGEGHEASPDGGERAMDAGDAASTQAMIRFAQLSPDAPALDVCIAVHGTSAFRGPLLAQFAEDAGLPARAGLPGLTLGDVSTYFAVDPGTYDVRLVTAGVASCTPGAIVPFDASTDADAGAGADTNADADAGTNADADAGADAGTNADADADADADAGTNADADANAGTGGALPPDVTNLPSVVAGEYATVLLAGDVMPVSGNAAFQGSIVKDDVTLTTGAASLRAINALPAVPFADVGFASFAGSWSPLFTNVAFGAASLEVAPEQGKVDANGYLPVAPFGPSVVSLRPATGATADAVSSSAVSVALGDVSTLIALGAVARGATDASAAVTGDAGASPELILCVDSAHSGSWLSPCSVLP